MNRIEPLAGLPPFQAPFREVGTRPAGAFVERWTDAANCRTGYVLHWNGDRVDLGVLDDRHLVAANEILIDWDEIRATFRTSKPREIAG